MSIPFDELIEEELKAMRLVEETRTKAEQLLSDARIKAQKIIDGATKTEKIQTIIKEEEEKAKGEKETILKNYRKKIRQFEEVSPDTIDKAVELAVEEVLRFE